MNPIAIARRTARTAMPAIKPVFELGAGMALEVGLALALAVMLVLTLVLIVVFGVVADIWLVLVGGAFPPSACPVGAAATAV